MINLVLKVLLITCTPAPHTNLIPLNQISRPGAPSAEEHEVERRVTTWGKLMQTDAKSNISSPNLILQPEHIVYVMKMQTVWDSDFIERDELFYPTSQKKAFYYWVFDAETGKIIGRYE
jgi:hypothetical protein